MKFPFFKQQDLQDCGPTCLRMLAKYYGKSYSIQRLRDFSFTDKNGSTLLGISDAAEKIGFRTQGVKLYFDKLDGVTLPCILHWRQNHFVILYKIKNNKYSIADPSIGLLTLSEKEFKENWFSHSELHNGICLLISTTPNFLDINEDKSNTITWSHLFSYFLAYKQLFLQLILGLIAGTIIQLFAPLLTQSIVDVGIYTKNLSFVTIILMAQIALFIGSISINFIRSWILLNISVRINLSILTDFLIKLMKLPLSYFERKTIGDIMQRITDQQKIENFLTNTTLNTLFSILNLFVFTLLLVHYNLLIFFISIVASGLYTLWITAFLKRRRSLNNKQFDLSAQNQTSLMELFSGIGEIKLNNSEKRKRWDWEQIQAKLFKFKVDNLTLNQYQQAGSAFINQTKNILITFISVRSVIAGEMTLGGMMAIQYLVGQVSNPIEQLVSFIQAYQDAKISLERLNEVHDQKDEELSSGYYIQDLPLKRTIQIQNLNFSYPGVDNPLVLKNINLVIPEGKITAIVGMSGSGKTTLMKLLLRVYEMKNGEIKIGKVRLSSLGYRIWRQSIGVVSQDGYIFNDTLLANITLGDENPKIDDVEEALNVANLSDFVSELPFGLYTKIDPKGHNLSQGQKQRLLIARAVYKNPPYLFFDEATNALDANNEREIMEKLNYFFSGRTVLIVAHRLSTVMNADNIVVLNKGNLVESGTHLELVTLKGSYYELVRNQLELGL
ncbi:peptidase domain-containing ABC transporter [Mucilaginibacter terrenus]|uniref:Multidrug resistance-like ATP-binding protein MdlB n=1 Tax=Mucilaginibacter terrenus TaxID=2482727 RepID=A0A3E2NSU3_9SPHI|nr:peptidase domain-containing ABC transporter [Mucilaginibacter terrenus]RFZ84064.1 peptidase domain-containing ABC transporter [Mucilaginibacter terrenus]